GAGATVVLFTLLLPHAPDRVAMPMLAAVVVAYAVVALMLVRRERLPDLVFQALPPLGTVLVSVVVLGAGAASVSAYAMMYFWVVLSAFYFFGRRLAAANMVCVALAYAGVLIIKDEATTPQIKWVMAVAALSVSGALIFKLRGRVDALITHLRRHAVRAERVADLQAQAIQGANASELMNVAVKMVAETLEAEHVGVLELLEQEEVLLLRWGTGWNDGCVGRATIPLGAPSQPTHALSSGQPMISADVGAEPGFQRSPLAAEHGCHSALAVPIVTRRGNFGVLGALSPRTGAFGPEEATFLRSVAGKLGSALDRQDHDEQLHQRAYSDALTGQPNRTQFLERLETALGRARAGGSQLAVFFLDLDNFKVVNDSLGHDAGDELLRAIAPRLRRALVLTDLVARFGGDEFVVMCEGVASQRETEAVAEAMLTSLAEPFHLAGVPHRVSASVGVASSDGQATAQELMRNADTAMYTAKARGRGHYELFDDRMRQKMVKRLSLENALAGALERDEFSLAYQPIVSLLTRRVEGVEALLRWKRADGSWVSPAEFIPIAEETGLIVPIGRWVLEQAVADLAGWRGRFGGDLCLNVNLSPKQVSEPQLGDEIATTLRVHGVPPQALALEITEGVLLEDSERTLSQLARLRELGTGLVLDDFGTGYSSLSYLRRLPLQALKIDRSFVAALLEGSEESAIVRAVAQMGAALGLSVVAEGVETEEQLERVSELGCTSAQGYLLARPMPAAEMEQFLERSLQDAPIIVAA
ncbi:MAG TPA: EAL domain-containing protein, partial [Solirubrobacteraceae bacterium]|nr:EAL domain-containing protein [Solirubrobacteraceae bacterium]